MSHWKRGSIFKRFRDIWLQNPVRAHVHSYRHRPQVILYSVSCNVLHWTDNNLTRLVAVHSHGELSAAIRPTQVHVEVRSLRQSEETVPHLSTWSSSGRELFRASARPAEGGRDEIGRKEYLRALTWTSSISTRGPRPSTPTVKYESDILSCCLKIRHICEQWALCQGQPLG